MLFKYKKILIMPCIRVNDYISNDGNTQTKNIEYFQYQNIGIYEYKYD